MKRGKVLAANGCAEIAGDVVIMRVAASDSASVVNLRSTDARVADYVFNAYVCNSLSAYLRAYDLPQCD
jgi:hypothetical protein